MLLIKRNIVVIFNTFFDTNRNNPLCLLIYFNIFFGLLKN